MFAGGVVFVCFRCCGSWRTDTSKHGSTWFNSIRVLFLAAGSCDRCLNGAVQCSNSKLQLANVIQT